ncbi:hypothetical protein [Aurantiacibacter sp. MUD61]|uniref:hypothetical protein n=1 Tax=Aurantiacibacter sp. MUD61 TaxID=3009083 RepID=UPI0022F10034|nr:hypothetical protein [Aurantiacibacter sp. MUD61]
MARALIARIPRNVAVVIATIAALGLARLMTYTDWAAANVTIAALLFAWIVIDTLCLSTIAKAENRRPGAFAMLSAAAIGALVVLVGGAPAVRERILAMPPLLAALAGTIALWAVWSGVKLLAARRAGVGWESALGSVLPPQMVSMWATELRMMHLALFVWRRAPDVPEGTRGFAYHRYLTPMLVTLIALQVIELGVVHLLLMLWNPLVAWIAFALTLAGLMWFVALTKSLRLMPVLVGPDYVRIRAGAPLDFTVPLDNIAAVGETFDADTLKAKSTIDTAILSAPNMTLRLGEPVEVQGLFGRTKLITHIALRLDEPAAFRAALDEARG